MVDSSAYKIQYSGLKEGSHEFMFLLDNKFFKSFEFSEVLSGNIDVNINFVKQTTFLQIDFYLQGFVEVLCDLCGDSYKQPINYKDELIVKFEHNEYKEIDENVIVLNYNDFEIDLSQYLYEFVNISIPLKRLHENDIDGNTKCNEESLKILELYKTKQTSTDWDALKKIKLNN